MVMCLTLGSLVYLMGIFFFFFLVVHKTEASYNETW